jgi:hypothetical protein
MSFRVDAAGMLLLDHGEPPAIVWITDTWLGDETDVRVLQGENYTNWSYIILVPRPLAIGVEDWQDFLTKIGKEIKDERS